MLREPDEWSRRGLERAALFSWARTAREHDAVYGELIGLTRLQVLELGVDQEAHERVERHLGLPAEPRTGAGRVADEVVQLCLAALQRLVDHHCSRQSSPTCPNAWLTRSSTECVSPLAST